MSNGDVVLAYFPSAGVNTVVCQIPKSSLVSCLVCTKSRVRGTRPEGMNIASTDKYETCCSAPMVANTLVLQN